MSYIGHAPTNAGQFVLLDDIDGLGYDGSSAYDQDFGSATIFKMQVSGVDVSPSADNLLLMLSGIVQETPGSYTVSGSTIVFDEAPEAAMTFYGILMGQSASVGAGTITTAEMAANSVDSDQYVNGSIDVEHLADNSIDEASLYADNSPTNDYALTAKSSATGGLTWAAVTDTNDDVSIANLKTRLAGGFGSNAVTIGDSGDTVTIAGNLQVSGTTVTIDAATLDVEDINITLGNGVGNDAAVNNGGITLESTGTDKTILWVDADDAWTFNQHIFPSSNALDLGGASDPWRNIYTSDLHLTNERGSWTVIEEEDYLTLRNNKNDKVYKLVMEEIE